MGGVLEEDIKQGVFLELANEGVGGGHNVGDLEG